MNKDKTITPEIQESNRDDKGRFRPGMSGNPNGRPLKEHSITDMIKKLMAENPEGKLELGKRILGLALAGDAAMIKLVWQYMDGMPEQHIKTEDVTEESEELTLLRSLVKRHERTSKAVQAQRKTN